jgi:hypothetical protein
MISKEYLKAVLYKRAWVACPVEVEFERQGDTVSITPGGTRFHKKPVLEKKLNLELIWTFLFFWSSVFADLHPVFEDHVVDVLGLVVRVHGVRFSVVKKIFREIKSYVNQQTLLYIPENK